MKQSRLHSLIESITNTSLGFGIGWWANLYVGLPMKTSFWLTVCLTVVSLTRGFLIRRAFNWWHHR